MRNSRVYADINLSAVLHNLEEMHKNISDETKIVAVIKTDAYGHGALPIAEAIEHVPYLWGYAVATVDEAMALIQDGRKKPILILGMTFREQFEVTYIVFLYVVYTFYIIYAREGVRMRGRHEPTGHWSSSC